jgi:hypothetical protein
VGVALLAAALAAAVLAPAARAADAPSAAEQARREAIERIEREIRKAVRSPRAAEKKDEVRKHLESLAALGGEDAAKAALEAIPLDDPEVEADALRLVETVRSKALVGPLAALIDHRDTRRRFRLHAGVAHALAVIGAHEGIEPLTALLGSEDAKVVAAAADALATFRGAPHAKRVEPVRRMVDLYERTWNLKESFKPDLKVARARAREDWEAYGDALLKSLHALTGQTDLFRPADFRQWWNDHKRDSDW